MGRPARWSGRQRQLGGRQQLMMLRGNRTQPLASGLRESGRRPLVGWLGGWGGRHSRAGHRQSWADARRWFPRRCCRPSFLLIIYSGRRRGLRGAPIIYDEEERGTATTRRTITAGGCDGMDACAGVGFRRDLGGRRMPRRVIRRDLDIPRGAARRGAGA